jgi:cysteine-rich repeat protein
MKIREVFPGSVANPNAQYVELQMYAGGQNLVVNHQLFVFDAAGNALASFTFPANVANGQSQATILIATAAAQSLFSVTADLTILTMTPFIPAGGGKICWDATNIDCVSWGSYSGSSAGTGTPFNVSGGLALSRAIRRDVSRSTGANASQLDAADDTNNSAADFYFALPAPQNNAGSVGTTPASTCGNVTIEGIEECDDGNTTEGDGCSSKCQSGTDADADGTADALDDCPAVANADQANSDADLAGDACDNCKCVSNRTQQDNDSDGAGTACDLLPANAVGLCLGAGGIGPQSQAVCIPSVGEVCL